jgi:methionyl-tRNA formyltransferase
LSPQRAVVFAYHNVGVRGLCALLALGLDVRLVVTHEDSPGETLWFQSVEELAEAEGLPVVAPTDPNTPDLIQRVRACAPDWVFSFYYRRLLCRELLEIPSRGAYNLHGSLLPKYRGRAPVNWAVLHGEPETGASLHRMVDQPDAGALVDQQAVRILPNDTAYDVFQKVTCAAEEVLLRAVPKMMAGSHTERPLDLGSGSYFGGRRPEDGRIDWAGSAWEVHNLVRAVAPPYPGAFTDIAGVRLMVLGSRFKQERAAGPSPAVYWERGACYADCADGRRLLITRIAAGGRDLDRQRFVESFGTDRLPVGPQHHRTRPSTP